MAESSVSSDRAAQASKARLELFAQIAQSIETLGEAFTYEGVRATRDRVASWAPWTITLPVWDSAYEALATAVNQDEFRGTLEATINALRRVLADREGEVPATLFGDVSHEVDQLRKVA